MIRSAKEVAPAQPAGILITAIWFGVLSGLGEAALLGAKKYLLHRFIPLYLFMNDDVFWMAPLASACLFAVLGLILYFAAHYWPKLASLHVAGFIFASLGFFSISMYIGSLHFSAVLLLSLGLAVQTAYFIRAHAQGFRVLVRRTTGWLVALLVGLALGIHGLESFEARRSRAKLAPPPVDERPNVLLIVLDTVRAQNLSLYGYERSTTPQLERLAKAGVVFARALATAPWTLPSHASMFTGRFHHELSADWQTPLDATYPTLAEVLGSHGYATAGFVANLLYCTEHYGLARGFADYEDYVVSAGRIINSSWLARSTTKAFLQRLGNHQDLVRKTAGDINNSFLDWLSREHNRPFFVFLNYFDAHAPYLGPGFSDRKFAPENSLYWLPAEGYRYSPTEIQELVANYDSVIAYLDRQLGLLFDALEKRGVLKNTLVIITSDHGEEFGEHHVMQHGGSLYMPALQVPLLIIFPSGLREGMRIGEPVSLRDIPATVMDLLKLDSANPFPGISLAQYWEGRGRSQNPQPEPIVSEVSRGIETPKWYPVSKGPMKSLMEGPMRYIKNGDGQEEIYNVEIDPWEKRNLIDSAEGQRVLKPFRTKLKTILNRHHLAK